MAMDALARTLALKFIKGKADLVDGKVPAEQLPSSGLEVIEWDGVRDFTEDEFNKLAENKACVAFVEGDDYTYFYVVYAYLEENNRSIDLCNFRVSNDGLENGSADYLLILEDGTYETYSYGFDELKGTKLYEHSILLSDNGSILKLISSDENQYDIESVVNVFKKGIVPVFYDYNEDAWASVHSVGATIDYSTLYIRYYDAPNDQWAVTNMTIISDTVTPL